MRQVHCSKFKKLAAGLDKPPYPNVLGQRIYEQISKEAWQAWLNQQTILINENRLDLLKPEARQFLLTAMQQFLFETA